MFLIECYVFIKTRNFAQKYTYKVTEEDYQQIKKYQLVVIPFHNQIVQGIIIRKFQENELPFKVKEIYLLIPDSLFNQYQIGLLENLSEQLIAPFATILKLFVPLGNKLQIDVSYHYPNGGTKLLRTLNKKEREEARELIKNGEIKVAIDYHYQIKKRKMKVLQISNPQNYTLTAKQQAVAQSLYAKYGGKETLKENLIQEESLNNYMYNKLKKSGIISENEVPLKYELYNMLKQVKLPALTPIQEEAFQKVKNSEKIVLLNGVTASGKTLLYLHLIEEVVKKDKQALILVPESTLTLQYIEQLSQIYQEKFLYLDQKMTTKDYLVHYNTIKTGEIKVIVGTKKALFSTFNNLELVIIDEAHDLSYQGFGEVRYNLKTFNEYFMANEIKIVYGTATPLVEDYARAKSGVYQLVELNERYKPLEKKETLILKAEKIINKQTVSEIEKQLSNGKNVMIIYPRLGYARQLSCENCNYTPRCPHCQSPLVYYKSNNKLVCHNCLYREDFHSHCAECKNGQYRFIGIGIEKYQIKLQEIFSQQTIYKVDSKEKLEDLATTYQKFQQEKGAIIIGTQILTKGIDFHNVELVVITNIDNLVQSSNFRGIELAYQLIEQAKGRAGRHSGKQQVIIETKNPDFYLFKKIEHLKYQNFYEEEIANRKLKEQLPYYNFIKIVLSHEKRELLQREMKNLKIFFQKNNLSKSTVLISSYTNHLGKYKAVIMVKYKHVDLKKKIEQEKEKLEKKGIVCIVDLNAITEERI